MVGKRLTYACVYLLVFTQNVELIHIGKRVDGGSNVAPGSNTYAVRIMIFKTDGSRQVCSGTVVSPNSVLTAAHCCRDPRNSYYLVEAGSPYVYEDPELHYGKPLPDNRQILRSTQCIMHEGHQPGGTNDVAILKLEANLDMSSVSAAKLPLLTSRGRPRQGESGTFVGFGLFNDQRPTLVAQLLPLTVISGSACQSFHAPDYKEKQHFCTNDNNQKHLNLGDSGGGFVMVDGGQPTIFGIMSVRLKVNSNYFGSLFMRVDDYNIWIRERI